MQNGSALRNRGMATKSGGHPSKQGDAESLPSSSSHQHPLHEHDSEHEHDHTHENGHAHSHSIFRPHSHSLEDGVSFNAEGVVKVMSGQGDRGSQITLLGLVLNVGLTVAKGTAGWFMNSAALLAEAWHSASGAP